MIAASFPAFVVRAAPPANGPDAAPHGSAEEVGLDDLPAGDVVVEVACSSLNYKDALAARGHSGIVGRLPHVPGIDAAGTVVASDDPRWRPGDRVLATGYELGAGRWGGFAQYIRVPADWPVALPAEISFREAMTLGTAGFTAAQAVDALQRHGIAPDRGPVAVTGATGGVGSLAVALLARLGYRVTAVTGKLQHRSWLLELGAAEVLSRADAVDASDRPLLSGVWAGAIDVAGGPLLTTLVRQLRYRGCVAACGLTAGAALPLTVYPFILRGAVLAGIDSAACPRDVREETWRRLFGPWRLPSSAFAVADCDLGQLPTAVAEMLAGHVRGRVLVHPRG